MKIEIDLNKSIEENAVNYFEKSKLAKKKIAGLKRAIINQNKTHKPKKEKNTIKKKWFQKYKWFFTSQGLLVVGGKTAQTNEEIVKKHMKKEDIYFHADIHGAPHCFIQTEKKKVSEQSMKEAAQFAITFSKAWEQGYATAEAYSVKPEQVSKRAPSGESLGTGAFMIYGERNWFKVPLSLAIGYYQKLDCLMAGPETAMKTKCSHVIILKQGTKEKNKVSKELQEKFSKKGLDFKVDAILSLLPNGNFSFA